MQPKPAPVVYVLPGTGGHRQQGSALGLAEMAYDRGFSAVVLSSAMNFEFVEFASSTQMPGYAPVDARDVHLALDAIDRDLQKQWPGRITKRGIMGMSLGAFHAIYIAAENLKADSDLIHFDRCIAINPPVSLRYAMGQLDDFYNVFADLPKDVQLKEVKHVVRRVLEMSGRDHLQPSAEISFSDEEAKFLIGLAFRVTLQGVIFQAEDLQVSNVLQSEWSKWDRSAVYQEISAYSFLEYYYGFVLPFYAARSSEISLDSSGAELMFEQCDLRSLDPAIWDGTFIRVYTNENDFLLQMNDLQWLRSTVHQECHHFVQGGHLGNLFLPAVQDEIMQSLNDLHSTAPQE